MQNNLIQENKKFKSMFLRGCYYRKTNRSGKRDVATFLVDFYSRNFFILTFYKKEVDRLTKRAGLVARYL